MSFTRYYLLLCISKQWRTKEDHGCVFLVAVAGTISTPVRGVDRFAGYVRGVAQ